MFEKLTQALKKTLIHFWKKRGTVLAVCILMSILLGAFHYWENSRRTTARMSLNYSEASLGLNPNRTRFNIGELTSKEVLERTIQSAGLEGIVSKEDLLECIVVTPVDVSNVNSSDNYINTTYEITFRNKLKENEMSADTLMRILGASYKEYFMEKYGENQGVFSNQMPIYFDSEPYLKLKSLEVRANQLNRYLNTRVSENEGYTDDMTGESFLSLSKQIQNIVTYDIPRIYAYILQSSLAENSMSLTSMLDYKLQIEQRNYDRLMAYYEADNQGISLYDEAMSAVVMIPTIDENNEFYMSRTKSAMDTMADSADSELEEATSHQDMITSTQYVMEQMSGASDGAQIAEANQMLENLSSTLDQLQESLRVTDASYIRYKTQDYLVFSYDAVSFAEEIGFKRIIVEIAVLLMLSAVFCFIRILKKEVADR